MINFRVVFNIMGRLLIIESIFMFLSTIISIIYNEPDLIPFFISTGITLFVGIGITVLIRKSEVQFGKREGYIIVSLVWVIFSFFGALPFYISSYIPSFTNAYFETISGFTTTGASILNDIEALPHGLLFWRSIIQWMGGMGIIVLSIAILPMLGIGGMQLFVAEVPGITPDKLHPKIKETAKRLWGIYVAFTFVETILLIVGGMNLFDAICHSFTTMATGGYSTKQASIGHFESPFIHYVIILFMFIAGTNFTLSYFAMKFNFKKIRQNEEFKFYGFVVFIFSLIITLSLYLNHNQDIESSIRDSLFQVVSIVTTTGYVTVDYLTWMPFVVVILFTLMFFGGSSGSTGGSIKMIRLLIVFKNSFYELKRLVHPNAVIPVRINNKTISPNIVLNVLAFIAFYIILFGIGVIVMSFLGLDLDSAMGSVAATLGNIGPGIGSVGPMFNFAHIHPIGKWILSFLMIVGRLEIFTVLILFSPSFWKK